MYKYIVLVHILAATVWAGGHLILVSTILPEAFKKKKIMQHIIFYNGM